MLLVLVLMSFKEHKAENLYVNQVAALPAEEEDEDDLEDDEVVAAEEEKEEAAEE